MYKVRVLVGGSIMVIDVKKNVSQVYRPDGSTVPGGRNMLDLEPYMVIKLAEIAQDDWMSKN